MQRKSYFNERHMNIESCFEFLPKVLLEIINQYVYEIKGDSNILTDTYFVKWISSFSDNSGQIVFGENDNIHIFDLKSNKICMTLNNHWKMQTDGVALFNKTIVYGTPGGHIIVWNPYAKKYESSNYKFAEDHTRNIIKVVEFQDTIISGCSRGEIKTWNISESNCVNTIYFNYLILFDVLFDGRIVCASCLDVKIWNNKTKRYDLTIGGSPFSPHRFEYVVALGNLIGIVLNYKKLLKIHDSITGQELFSFPCENGREPAIAALPDGKIIYGNGNIMDIFDPYSGICEKTLNIPNDETVVYIKVLHDGRIISYSRKYVCHIGAKKYFMRIWS